jgi:hypothetical protein
LGTSREIERNPNLSHFDVLLQHDPAVRSNTVRFVRQGLTLSELLGPHGTGLVGLVSIEDDALAQLLRDAENPAHTKWLVRSDRLMKHFIGGPERVKFVESAPRVLLKRLLQTEEKLDTELLADLFPDPDPQAAHPGTGGGQKKGKKSVTPPPPPPPKPQPVRIHKVAGGFAVTRDPAVPLRSRRLQIEAAFDCIGANPLKAWEPFDFSMDSSPIEVTLVGGSMEEATSNRLRVRIDSDDFQLEVRGFPETRDLAVRPRWLASGDIP